MKTRLEHLIAYGIVLTAVLISACSRPVPAPSKDERSDSYARLSGGLNLGYGPIIAELYADTATTTWGDATVKGLDDISKNWKRILEGAHVDQAPRSIVKTETGVSGVLRDSGRIVLRLRDTVKAGAFRDTTMMFITRWGLERNTKRWVILSDTIAP